MASVRARGRESFSTEAVFYNSFISNLFQLAGFSLNIHPNLLENAGGLPSPPENSMFVSGELLSIPIDDDEWDSGRTRDKTEEEVHAFLQNNPDQAFTAYEIANALNRIPQTYDSDELEDLLRKGIVAGINNWAISIALDNLVEEGAVEVRAIEEEYGEDNYYRILQ